MKATAPYPEKGLIDVLYIPFGKRDYDRQIFTKETNFRKEDQIIPGVLDFHGAAFGGSPEDVGKVIKRWTDEDGKWATILLDSNNENWAKYINAAEKGSLYVSPGAIEGYFSWDESGFITDWATGEISLIIADGTKRPKNWYAIAKTRSEAIMKAAHVPYEPIFDNIKIKKKKVEDYEDETNEDDEDNSEKDNKTKGLSNDEINLVRELLQEKSSSLKSIKENNNMNDTPCNCQDDLARKDAEISELKAQVTSLKAISDECASSKSNEVASLKAALDERSAQNSALKAALDNEIAKATDKEDEDFLKGLIENGQIEPSAKESIKNALKAARLSDNNGLKGSSTPENGLYTALKTAYESRPKSKGFSATIIPLTNTTNVTDMEMVNKLLKSGGYKEII